MKVSAVIVSKMDRPDSLGLVVGSIAPHVEDITIVRGQGGVLQRWLAAAKPRNAIVYTQDDDAIVDVGAVLEQYEYGKMTCNMPMDRRQEYANREGVALVDWGCVFTSYLVVNALRHYWRVAYSEGQKADWNDAIWRSEADRVVTALSPVKLIDVTFEHLDAAHGDDRMGRRACHGEYLQEILRRIRIAKGVAQ